ncbi:hypothetical protein MKEN_00214300 [Mycena kentingensis (nom. inval.)]|nr:hypothetical protein MKEN_00214300 [Mycena kentingensis (nom. inval.)]
MVHRPADSRLLGHLLTQEKEYAKHLATLLDHSNASLASVTAYGSASSPASAALILAVSGSLATADEALRGYATAVERWRDYLKELKTLEDEVGTIMRDREILAGTRARRTPSSKGRVESTPGARRHFGRQLGRGHENSVLTTFYSVTRLIKASKPVLHTSSSTSLPLSSPSQSASSLPFSANTQNNAKLVAAQTELQACEAHLAAKEAELEVRRAALVREGLAGRCRALAECGARWQDAGRAGALAATGGAASASSKPLPGVGGSDVSLAPSQSASQIEPQPYHPPAPSSSDHHHTILPPTDLVPVVASGSKFAPRMLARRITEEDLVRVPAEDDAEGSSVAEEDAQAAPLEVVENPRFANAHPNGSAPKVGSGILAKRHSKRPAATLQRNSTYGSSTMSVPTPTASKGFFGSIRGLFGGKNKDGSGSGRLKRASAKRDAGSDDEPDVRSEPPMSVSAPRKRVVSDIGSQRRRGADAGMRRAEEWVSGNALVLPRRADSEAAAAAAVVEEKGWASDGEGTVKRKKSNRGTVRSIESAGSAGSSTAEKIEIALEKKPKRRSSLNVSGSAAEALVPSPTPSPSPPPPPPPTTRAERRTSLPVSSRNADAPSLMSIVENVSRANRTGWAAYNGVGMGNPPTTSASPTNANIIPGLVEVKAPRLDKPVASRGRTMSASGVGTIDGLPRAPGSIFATPAVPSTFAGPSPSTQTQKRPAKSPLRSALRNSSSATPSPPSSLVAQQQAPVIVAPVAVKPVSVPVAVSLSVQPAPPSVLLNGKGKGTQKAVMEDESDVDDTASISSYATGIEEFEDAEDGALPVVREDDSGDETEHEHEPPPPPVPEHDWSYTNGVALHDSQVAVGENKLIEDFGRGSDLSTSSASTSTPQAVPRRRKSVRVSLQPTFSATPPATPYDDEVEEEPAPWGNGSKQASTPDMWEDSSEEDVEYQNARKLLTKLAKKKKSSA